MSDKFEEVRQEAIRQIGINADQVKLNREKWVHGELTREEFIQRDLLIKERIKGIQSVFSKF